MCVSMGDATRPRVGSNSSRRLSVEEYRNFFRDGYLIVRGLFSNEAIEELRVHTNDLLYGRVSVPQIPPAPPEASPAQLEARLLRVHMLHRELELHEQVLLDEGVLDVVAALIGPDVIALQTMLFFKAPGAQGQGFHQDSYYIPTFPDSLIGAWIALDPADETNGCLWMSKGSQCEPIYPPDSGYGYGNRLLNDVKYVSNVGGASNDDEDPLNGLGPIAARYRIVETPCVMAPGDVAFFGGHILHRSLSNKSGDRFRRAFVSHYCNARSYTPWDGGNARHILARGATNLEFAQPKFGTPCAANHPEDSQATLAWMPQMNMGMPDGRITAQVALAEADED